MIPLDRYLRLGFLKGGRDRPAVDCWGLYRLILGEQRGVWLPEFAGTQDLREVARQSRRSDLDQEWLEIRAGEERPLDLVLMTGLLGEGRDTIAAPTHVGCVIGPARMIDIEERTGVMVRAFRSTSRFRAADAVANRVRGVFRPMILAGGEHGS